MNSIEIGQNIKKARKKRNLTQKELADRIGKTESSIRKYEKGLVQIPIDVLEQIALVLEVSPFDLMGSAYWDEKYNKNCKLDDEVKLIEIVEEKYGKGSASLLEDYSSLNEIGKSKACEYVSDLAEQPKYQKNPK